jgi:hypothetical protein
MTQAAADERAIVRENITYTRAAQRKLREIAEHRFPGRKRVISITLEQLIEEEYQRVLGSKSK